GILSDLRTGLAEKACANAVRIPKGHPALFQALRARNIMIILRAWRASITRNSEGAFHDLAGSVPGLLRPLIRPAREEQVRILGIGLELADQETAANPAYGLGPRSRTV